MSSPAPTGFFAYPSLTPARCEAIRRAVEHINRTQQAVITTWEALKVSGTVVIDTICRQIGRSDLFCADLTTINANVMFELGYAIATNKRAWLIRDSSLTEANREFDQLRILTTVGYRSCISSDEIIKGFFTDQPHLDLSATIFRQSIEPSLQHDDPSAVLFLQSPHTTDVCMALIRRVKELESARLPVVTDDPQESVFQSLTWYGRRVFAAEAVVCHLTDPGRQGAVLHNARCALVAGMAYGMGKSLLMLAEGTALAPIDYRDMLVQPQTASQVQGIIEPWFQRCESNWHHSHESVANYIHTVKLATELKGLQVGECLAEHEVERLVNDYFVETAAYHDALRGSPHSIFVGRKGSGKTANLLKLAAVLREDHRNLVCVVAPVAYEWHSIIELLRRYNERDQKGYVIEALWKVLLFTEIANAAALALEERPIATLQADELAFLQSLGEEQWIRGDFSIRLERCLAQLLTLEHAMAPERMVEGFRVAVSEALHSTHLSKLRAQLGQFLSGRRRVVLLVDNLDKAWDRGSELSSLAEFLLGLLRTAPRVPQEFRRASDRRDPVDVSLVVFVRTDIFDTVVQSAREPDKLQHTRLVWRDPELLLRVLDERFAASHEGNISPSDVWERYFCGTVRGIPTKQYITECILPRPRDLVFLVKAAMATAVNRAHAVVDESDVLEAERQYSQHAVGSVLVEGGVVVPNLDDILYYFMGCNARLDEDEVASLLASASVAPENTASVVDHLCALSFLGVEVAPGDARFAEDAQEHRRNAMLARKTSQALGRPAIYAVNRPFWAFLEVRPMPPFGGSG